MITQPLLSYLKQPFFLSKKHAISVYILSHQADFDSSMSLHKYYFVSTTFSDSSLMMTGPARPNHGEPAGRDFHYTLQPHSRRY